MKQFYKIFRIGIFAVSFIQLSLGNIWAQEVGFEASVDSTKVTLEETIQLALTFSNAKSDRPPEIPPIDGIEVRYLGPSTSLTVINGQSSSRTSYIFTLFPQKTGKFRIPSINVSINGKPFKSDPIDIEVLDSSAGASSGNTQGASAGTQLKDRIFLTLETSRKEFYENEKIPVKIKLYINGLAVQDVQYPQFAHEGFSIDPFPQPKQYEQVVGGVRYQVVEFETSVYSDHTGNLKLGPATLACNIVFKNSDHRKFPSGDLDNFFNDDFFDGFLTTYQKRPITLNSIELPITALPLPQEGKPESFSKAVGTFSFEASASPQEVKVGDPVTVKMSVWGEGNLQSVQLPSLKEDDNFKVYDPQIKEENGKKVLEQVIIPKNEQVAEIPTIGFFYFAPQANKYENIVQGPFPLKVKKGETQNAFKVIGFDQTKPQAKTSNEKEKKAAPSKPESIGRDIVFIKESPGYFRPLRHRLDQNLFFIFTWILTAFVWIGLAVFYHWKRRLETDTVYARRLKAPQKARQGIEEAENFLKEGKQKEFYDTIHKTLQEYLADKFHLPLSGGIRWDAIEKKLQESKLREDFLQKLRRLISTAEMVRYASIKIDMGQMTENFQEFREMIDYLERNLR